MLQESENYSSMIKKFNPNFAINESLSIDQLKSKAKGGDSCAQLNLSLKYQSGDGVEQDNELSLKWLNKSVDQGDQISEYVLGMMLLTGENIKQNEKKGFEIMKRSADQGFSPAECSMGMIYRDGIAVEQNFIKSASWFTRSVEQENPVAMNELALLFAHGTGVERNNELAMMLLKKSSDMGYKIAEENLNKAINYINSLGDDDPSKPSPTNVTENVSLSAVSDVHKLKVVE